MIDTLVGAAHARPKPRSERHQQWRMDRYPVATTSYPRTGTGGSSYAVV